MSMKVMIVDDMPSMVLLVSKYIERVGGEVVGKAYSGEDALKLAESLDFDVIIIDYLLPDMDGLKVAERIEEMRSDVKIVIMTSVSDFECEKYPVLRKPFGYDDVKSVLYQN